MCVRLNTAYYFVIELFYIEEMMQQYIMGRGRKGLTEQSRRNPKRTLTERQGMEVLAFVKNRETKKIPLPEHVVDFMKNMNPQQLVDFLLPKEDDWYVKTSSGNASGN